MKSLRPYQYKVLQYCKRQKHPALFVDMRLGKTLITIRTIQSRPPGLNLVVAPSAALGSWETELQDHSIPFQSLAGITASKREAILFDAQRKHQGWYLINKEGFLSVPGLALLTWENLIIDESTALKNPKAQITKYFCKYFRDAKHRWILSGTPAPENSLELFSQLKFLDGEAFGFNNYWLFREKLFVPYQFAWYPGEGTVAKMVKYVSNRCYVLRRKDVHLPQAEITTVNRSIQMSDDFWKKYQQIESEFATQNHETMFSVVQFNWLLQLTGGIYENEFVYQQKAADLLNLLLDEFANENVVVWFKYNAEIEFVSQLLSKHKIGHQTLTGKIPIPERESIRASFGQKDKRILLTQILCAQFGMNLSVADTAIYYSRVPSLLNHSQSYNRIQLPTKQSQLLYVNLVVPNTVDEDILFGLAGKKLTSGMLMQKIKERNDRK
jgi:hypothetical protein